MIRLTFFQRHQKYLSLPQDFHTEINMLFHCKLSYIDNSRELKVSGSCLINTIRNLTNEILEFGRLTEVELLHNNINQCLSKNVYS